MEELKRLREEKIRQIAQKRQQIEELKRQRAERQTARLVNTEGMSSIQAKMAEGAMRDKVIEEDLDRNISNLIAEIVYEPPVDPKAKAKAKGKAQDLDQDKDKKKVAIERPLQELKNFADKASKKQSAADRSLTFQEDFRVNVITIETASGCSYERAAQTDLTGDDLKEQKEKWGGMMDNFAMNLRTASVLKRMAKKARANIHNRRIGEEQAAQAEEEVGPVAGEAAPGAASGSGGGYGGYRFRAFTERAETMDQEERELLEGHPDFQAFFHRTTLLVERTLGKQHWDHRGDEADLGEQELMRYLDSYVEDRLTLGRPVTDVRFSPHHSQLFLASYRERANAALSDVPGCVLVWNMAMSSRPEAAFTSASAVLTAQFHRTEPALFFGGTYSGGVVLWDARAKAGPVMRSPLCGRGHSHPVQAMQQVGTENSANLVTASNDGRLCVWSMAKLNEPSESIDLRAAKGPQSAKFDLAMMSMAFPAMETNTVYAGAEDGTVAQVHIHGSKTGVTELYDGHAGPVTSLDMHPNCQDEFLQNAQSSSSLFDSLMLSSSFDWSVKMWDLKKHTTPLLSLDSFEDYVLDVKWHPSHPAIFSAVDGEGYAHLWNLNRSTESAVARLQNPSAAQRRLALNRCAWSGDGRRLATGDSEGMVAMYTMDRSVWEPRSEDILQFKDFVGQLKPLPRAGAARPVPDEGVARPENPRSSVHPSVLESRAAMAASAYTRQ